MIGLKTKFSTRVRVVGLGAGSLIRGLAPDFNLEIDERDIQPGDIEMLMRELNLKETTPTTLDALVTEFGRDGWFNAFQRDESWGGDRERGREEGPCTDSVAAWANSAGVNVLAAEGLRSKMQRVFNLALCGENPAGNGIEEIIKTLEAGQHVILSFYEHESDLDYLLVSNLLTRRIREAWEKSTNDFRSQG